MIRSLFSGRNVLLILAIAFVAALLVSSKQGPPVDDPVGDSLKQLQESFGLSVDRELSPPGGLKVTGVAAGKPAQLLGLKKDDRILTVNEYSIWHAKQLADYLSDGLERGPVRLMVKNGTEYRVVFIGGNRMAGSAGGRGGPGNPLGPGRQRARQGRMSGASGPAPGRAGGGRGPAAPSGGGGRQ